MKYLALIMFFSAFVNPCLQAQIGPGGGSGGGGSGGSDDPPLPPVRLSFGATQQPASWKVSSIALSINPHNINVLESSVLTNPHEVSRWLSNPDVLTNVTTQYVNGELESGLSLWVISAVQCQIHTSTVDSNANEMGTRNCQEEVYLKVKGPVTNEIVAKFTSSGSFSNNMFMYSYKPFSGGVHESINTMYIGGSYSLTFSSQGYFEINGLVLVGKSSDLAIYVYDPEDPFAFPMTYFYDFNKYLTVSENGDSTPTDQWQSFLLTNNLRSYTMG